MAIQITDDEWILHFCTAPILILVAVWVLIDECTNRKESMQDFRYFFHIILSLYLVTQICDMISFFVIAEEQNGVCRTIGKIRTFAYAIAFIYVVQLGRLMLKSLKDPTFHHLKHLIFVHVSNWLISLILVILAGVFFGFGIQLNLTCGIDALSSKYSGLSLSFPLLLVPIILRTYCQLEKLPKLVKTTLQSFIFQYFFYCFFFFFYALSVMIIDVFLYSSEQPSSALRMILDVLD